MEFAPFSLWLEYFSQHAAGILFFIGTGAVAFKTNLDARRAREQRALRTAVYESQQAMMRYHEDRARDQVEAEHQRIASMQEHCEMISATEKMLGRTWRPPFYE